MGQKPFDGPDIAIDNRIQKLVASRSINAHISKMSQQPYVRNWSIAVVGPTCQQGLLLTIPRQTVSLKPAILTKV